MYESSSDHYSIRYRFDLDMRGWGRIRSIDDDLPYWKQQFEQDTHFALLHRMADFDDVPFDLDDICNLYRRQISAGRKERLAWIRAVNLKPWGTSVFESFASLASTTLTTLMLAMNMRSKLRPQILEKAVEFAVSFSDLPSIISSISTHLPNLVTFHLRLNDIETAEEVFSDLLTEDPLDRVGTIRDLLIISNSKRTNPLFNTIRYIAQICAEDAEIFINSDNDRFWDLRAQNEYLKMLRNAEPRRRAKLATVDFTKLGIINPYDILNLKYLPDGTPLRVIEGSAIRWDDTMKQAYHSSMSTHLPNYHQRAEDYNLASSQIREISTNRIPTSEELLLGSEKLLEAAVAMRKAVEALHLISDAQVEELRRYVEGVKLSVKAENGISEL